MSTALAWLSAGGALLLLPPAARAGARGVGGGTRQTPGGGGATRGAARPQAEGRAVRPAATRALAGWAFAGLSVALLGVRHGLVIAGFACPALAFGIGILERRTRSLPVDRTLALTLDLTAAALRSGHPPAAALSAAAAAAEPSTARALQQVAGLLGLGAEPARAWAVLDRDGPLGPVAAAATRSASSGIKLAQAFERLAADIRAEVASAAAARAERAGVLAMAPLAACFLPSFVCLGIIPVVVGIARTALGGIP